VSAVGKPPLGAATTTRRLVLGGHSEPARSARPESAASPRRARSVCAWKI
jgi:hypothetical protein